MNDQTSQPPLAPEAALPSDNDPLAALVLQCQKVIYSDPKQALPLTEKIYTLAVQLNDTENIAESYRLMGVCYLFLSNYDRSLEKSRLALARFEQLGDKNKQANIFNTMGTAYLALSDYSLTSHYYFKSLKLKEDLADQRGQGVALDNIGNLYHTLGNHAKALSFRLRALSLRREINDRRGLAASLNNTGVTYEQLGDYPAALDCHFESLKINQEINDAWGEGRSFINIASIYDHLDDASTALEYAFKALKIVENIGNKQDASICCERMGGVYQKLHDYANALKYHLKSLKMAEDIGDKRSTANALNSVGEVYRALGDAANATHYYAKSLTIREQIDDREGQMRSHLSIGNLHLEQKNFDAALASLQRGLALADEMERPAMQSLLHQSLSEAYKQTGRFAESVRHSRLYHQLREQFFNDASQHKAQTLLIEFEVEKAQKEAGFSEIELPEVRDALRRAGKLKVGRFKNTNATAQRLALPVEPASPEIFIKTFGKFSVTVSGRELTLHDWQRKKARDVFKVLLIHHRQAVTMDALVNALWPEASDANTELVLQKAISYIRKALEPTLESRKPSRFLTYGDKTYTLDLGHNAFIDFIAFKHLIAEAAHTTTFEARVPLYEKAVSLYGGDFLKEDTFSEWASYECESLKESYMDALVFLAEHHLAEGRADNALAAVEKILACDRSHLKAAELGIKSWLQKQQPEDARKFYRRCKDAFRKHLGIAPPPSLERLLA
jgi:DNA-binding SARP family transcriptional activator/uncharacterized protein HemY